MRIRFLVVAVLAVSGLQAADPQADANARLELLQTTKMNCVASFTGRVQDFVPDEDLGSIQIVVLASKSQGQSQVSPDGQVIFLRKSDERKMQRLMEEAFTKLIAARSAAHPDP